MKRTRTLMALLSVLVFAVAAVVPVMAFAAAPSSCTVALASGQTLYEGLGGSVSLTATLDAAVEDEDGCTVTISAPTGCTFGSNSSTTVTFAKDEGTTPTTITPNLTVPASAATGSSLSFTGSGVSTVSGSIVLTPPTVTLSSSTLSVEAGKSVNTLSATTVPATLPGGASVKYGSSDTSIATVDETSGAVTGVAEGTATITAGIYVGDAETPIVTGTCSVTVTAPAPAISLSPATQSVAYGGTATVTATIANNSAAYTPQYSTDGGTTWTDIPASGKIELSGITENQTVKAKLVKSGQADINAPADATVTVNTPAITKIAAAPTTAAIGGSSTVTATLKNIPNGATIQWTVTSPNASVDPSSAQTLAAGATSSTAQVSVSSNTPDKVALVAVLKVNGAEVARQTFDGITVSNETVADNPTEQPTEPTSGTTEAPAPETPVTPPTSSDVAPTAPPAASPSSAPADSESPSPSASPGASGSPSGSAEPSSEPTSSASAEPSGAASAEPSSTPTASESAAPPVEFNPEASDVPSDVEISEKPDGEGSVLTGISLEPEADTTTVETVASWIAVPDDATVEVLDADGEPADTSAPIGTGMIIEVRAADGTVLQSTTIVVKGDVTGSGTMNLTQLVRMAQGYTGTDPLTGAYADAADLNGDGKVSLTDLVIEARMYREAELGD